MVSYDAQAQESLPENSDYADYSDYIRHLRDRSACYSLDIGEENSITVTERASAARVATLGVSSMPDRLCA